MAIIVGRQRYQLVMSFYEMKENTCDGPWMMAQDPGDEERHGGGSLATEEARPQLKRPPMYRVVLMNDDYTPMDFVVEVLMIFFNMNQEKATQVMLSVHTQGKGVCGVYTRDVAETKAAQVNQYSRENKHPLLCEVETV